MCAGLREGLQLSQRLGEHPAIAQYAEGLETPPAEVLADDDALDAYIRANGSHNFHPVGTAKMGRGKRPRRGRRCTVPGARGRGAAGGGRLGHAGDRAGKHQPDMHHDRGAGGGDGSQ